MSAKLLIAPERTGRTFGIAVRILGVVALLQMVVILWALLIRFDGRPRGVQSSVPVLTSIPTPPVVLPTTPPAVDLPPASVTLPPVTSEPDDVPMIEPTPRAQRSRVEHPAHRVTDLESKALLNRALRLREEGDITGALGALKQADGRLPNHPKLLAEIATTYSQIGQTEKAGQYWERVHQMGSERAGAYWDLSDMALKGHLMEDATTGDTELRITRNTAHRMESESGQKVILRIHTESTSDIPLAGEEMYLYVFFYDMAEYPGGSRIEETVAKMTQRLITEPYDWRDGEEEVIEVEYLLDELTKDQEAALGQRQFYGYVVELYYRDVLQDVVASPRKLIRDKNKAPEGIPYQGSSLFPQ